VPVVSMSKKEFDRLEAGADRGHAAVSAVPAASLAVPATLHASLLGRLDRLGPAAKKAAHVGAAIGRDFSYELTAAAAQLDEPELQDALRRLVESGLVFQRGLPPAAEYLFKHALVQDTAYSILLRGPRRRLHRRIADGLNSGSPTSSKHGRSLPPIITAKPTWLTRRSRTGTSRVGCRWPNQQCERRARSCAEA
jgi:predicted ATPase